MQCLKYSDFKWAYEHNCDIIQDYKTGEIIFESRETGEILKIIEKIKEREVRRYISEN